jgi:diguanylate cyclase (GGDEF)-like protein
MVPRRLGQRQFLVATSFALYVALVFFGLARLEVPGLGVGHLLYLPIAMLALATGPLWGAVAGAVATGVYLLGAVINPHFHAPQELLSAAGAIRFATFSGIGYVVGSAAKRNRELMQRLKDNADRDFLTDLLNTRAFETALTERIDAGVPFTLVLLDVDDLKLVNDTEGHAAGNEHLRRLAAVLREETDPEDTVARIGGDEFAVMTSVADPARGSALSERLQAALAGREISASAGYATHPDEGGDRIALFHVADKRLYKGKTAVTRDRLRSVS